MDASTVASEVPMLALIDAGGEIKRSTDAFRRRYPGTTVPSGQWNTCERVLSGHARRAVVDIDGVEAAVEAVTDHRGLRHLLLSLPAVAVDAGGALLEQGVADSEAIVYLKDLSGRYLCINKLYAEFLYTTEDRVVGRSDPELERRETIDGPRLR